jgi:hypothetical protein
MFDTQDLELERGSFLAISAFCKEDGFVVAGHGPDENKKGQYIGLHLKLSTLPKAKSWYVVLAAPQQPDLNWSDILDAVRKDATVDVLLAADYFKLVRETVQMVIEASEPRDTDNTDSNAKEANGKLTRDRIIKRLEQTISVLSGAEEEDSPTEPKKQANRLCELVENWRQVKPQLPFQFVKAGRWILQVKNTQL